MTAFDDGQIWLIGRSGSKTVLMKLLEISTHTERRQNMCTMDSFHHLKAIEKETRSGNRMVFQGGAIRFLTIQENVMFPLNMLKENLSEEEKLERVNFCLKE